MFRRLVSSFFFFFNDTATTEIYTLSLHDALPILKRCDQLWALVFCQTSDSLMNRRMKRARRAGAPPSMNIKEDRKSTRLNSSHLVISYAVFCLKKKKKTLNHSADEYSASAAAAPS